MDDIELEPQQRPNQGENQDQDQDRHHEQDQSTGQTDSGGSDAAAPSETEASATTGKKRKTTTTTTTTEIFSTTKRMIRSWWVSHIRPVITVEQGSGAMRDYLALERTYLAYIRTSNIIASFAILTVQLFILRRRHGTSTPTVGVGKAVAAGKSLACIAIAVAILTVITATRRYFLQQGMLQEKKFLTRGWDLVALGGLGLAVCLLSFVLVLVF